MVAGAVGASEIGNDVINSQHYAAGSIDNEHIANDAINSEHYAAGSIDNEHIANDAINSEHYANGSIDNAHIADNAINSEHYADNSIDALHLNVSGNGTTSQYLRSDGDGTFSWVTPPNTNTTYSVGNGGLTQQNFTNADHTKLNGIETGATADQTAAQILTAIKTVDGSGSGLDADLLDGQHASAFLGVSATASKAIKLAGAGPNTQNLNTVADSTTAGQLEYRAFNTSSSNAPPMSDNANGVISVGQHSGNYGAQLAFSSNGNMYWRDNPSTSFGSWRKVWDSGNDGSGSGLDADTVDGKHKDYLMHYKGTVIFIVQKGRMLEQIFHEGDSNTYIQFHASDQWRVVTGGAERLEVNNSAVTVAGTLNAATVRADAIYSNNDGTSGYFYNDNGTRTAYRSGDFYLQSSVVNYYNYATNIHLGASSGDTVKLRGNQMIHNGWTAQADGHIRMNDGKHIRFGNGADAELFCDGSHMYMDLNSGIGNFYIRDATHNSLHV